MCSLCTVQSPNDDLSAQTVRVKRTADFYCRPWLLTVVNKDSFGASKAVLFTGASANKARMFLLSYELEPLKRKGTWCIRPLKRLGRGSVACLFCRELIAVFPLPVEMCKI